MSKTGLYTVERIVGKRIRDTKYVEYKVKWEGYPSSQNTWQPIKNLSTVNSLIREFEERNKDKLPAVGAINGINKHLVGRNDSDSKLKPKNGIKVKMETTKPPNRQAIRTPQPPKQRLIKLRKDVSQSQEMKPEQYDPQSQKLPDDTSEPQIDLIDLNISDIAEKILAVSIMKDKGYKVVQVIKKLHPIEEVIYIVQDMDGSKKEYNRQRMLEQHPQELLDFYEARVHEKCSLPE